MVDLSDGFDYHLMTFLLFFILRNACQDVSMIFVKKRINVAGRDLEKKIPIGGSTLTLSTRIFSF